MNREEVSHIAGAVVIFTAILALSQVISSNYSSLGIAFVSAAVVIAANIGGKKIMAYLLDADVEHRIWSVERFGLKAHKHLKRPALAGIIVPIVLSLLTLGWLKVSSFLVYETRALKVRAAKRFGYYSYTEMTDWHNALIGAAGMVLTLVVMTIAYLSDFEPMAKAAALYAFWNMFPVSNLDGTQIFFGSRVLWTVLAVLAAIAGLYAVTLV